MMTIEDMIACRARVPSEISLHMRTQKTHNTLLPGLAGHDSLEQALAGQAIPAYKAKIRRTWARSRRC